MIIKNILYVIIYMPGKLKLKKQSKKIKNYNKNTNKNTINIKIGLNSTKRKRKPKEKAIIKKVEGVSTMQPYYVNPQNTMRPSNYQNQAYYDNVKVKNDKDKNPETPVKNDAFKSPEITGGNLNGETEIKDKPNPTSLSKNISDEDSDFGFYDSFTDDNFHDFVDTSVNKRIPVTKKFDNKTPSIKRDDSDVDTEIGDEQYDIRSIDVTPKPTLRKQFKSQIPKESEEYKAQQNESTQTIPKHFQSQNTQTTAIEEFKNPEKQQQQQAIAEIIDEDYDHEQTKAEKRESYNKQFNKPKIYEEKQIQQIQPEFTDIQQTLSTQPAFKDSKNEITSNPEFNSADNQTLVPELKPTNEPKNIDEKIKKFKKASAKFVNSENYLERKELHKKYTELGGTKLISESTSIKELKKEIEKLKKENEQNETKEIEELNKKYEQNINTPTHGINMQEQIKSSRKQKIIKLFDEYKKEGGELDMTDLEEPSDKKKTIEVLKDQILFIKKKKYLLNTKGITKKEIFDFLIECDVDDINDDDSLKTLKSKLKDIQL